MHNMKTSKRIHLGIDNEFQGVLDSLGISENAVYVFSPFKNILSGYTGNAVKVQRTSDNESEWFRYKSNGDLDTASILKFCGSSDGLIEEVVNLFNTSYNAKQTTVAYKPKIVESGVLNTNGIHFDGSDDFMNIEKYSDINILDHPLSIFAQGITSIASTGYYIVLNTDGSDSTYGLYTTTSPQVINFKLNTSYITVPYTANVQENIMCAYEDGGTDAQKLVSNSDSSDTDFSSTLNEHSFLNIGCRSTAVDNSTHSYFFNGYMKTIIIFKTSEYSKYNNLVNNI